MEINSVSMSRMVQSDLPPSAGHVASTRFSDLVGGCRLDSAVHHYPDDPVDGDEPGGDDNEVPGKGEENSEDFYKYDYNPPDADAYSDAPADSDSIISYPRW